MEAGTKLAGVGCDICEQMGNPAEAIGHLCVDEESGEVYGDTNAWFTEDKSPGLGQDECTATWYPYTCQEAEHLCSRSGPPQGTTWEGTALLIHVCRC